MGRLFAVRVPEGLHTGSVFEAEIPGHGFESVKVPQGVHSGQVLRLFTVLFTTRISTHEIPGNGFESFSVPQGVHSSQVLISHTNTSLCMR